MKKLLLITMLWLSALNIQAKELTFGKAVNADSQVKISAILANPEAYLHQNVTVKGTIVGVCSHRGCWMELASDAKFEKLRIKVRDGDMVFPLYAKGREALATGKLQEIALSLKQTKQYQAQIAKRKGEAFDSTDVTESMSIYQLSPIGVKVLD
ncbi:DUF4920 domain-containing protein [Pseudoalteromonas sp. MMG010]|uniref:DUF4920 domain-containing protein n=1 Tax=Pseudoalteromonas sp. MMG010 TaxID=2822685 RepID=UPI001B3A79F2|nr:DUF4920 domain-containing protein [Pseudoalteromonas sp. MMG010]MBQ4832118.1 DUF4920 domain-containing protein [Pseudoalteromonas sp. MMG010]